MLFEVASSSDTCWLSDTCDIVTVGQKTQISGFQPGTMVAEERKDISQGWAGR